MIDRFLTITAQADWQAGLRTAGKATESNSYQGEILNFENPGHFFGQLTEKRWEIVRASQGKEELSVRDLARIVRRDIKRVHEDIGILSGFGLLERTDGGGVVCPFASMHIDMYLQTA